LDGWKGRLCRPPAPGATSNGGYPSFRTGAGAIFSAPVPLLRSLHKERMKTSHRLVLSALTLSFAAGCAAAGGDAPEGAVMAPQFEVDPMWPKPLPNHWVLGSAIGIDVDAEDHIWIVHRGNGNLRTELGASTDPPTGECCLPAPNILEFDKEGNLLSYFGGPGEGYDWPESNHGITVDPMGNLWIGGNVGSDGHILVFAQDGTFLRQIGKPGANTGSHDQENFGRVAEVSFDASANEAYVADGYGNKRVVVLDINTGEFLRYWGAYGNPPSDSNFGRYQPGETPLQQFRSPVHCAQPSLDGLVYVCDRPNDRIQIFQTDGTFVSETFVATNTMGDGSTWDISFSRDDEQKYIYLADGKNMKVYIMDRASMEILTSFGDGGRQPGQFFAVHSIATDSDGNIYTTETYEGKRIQKFVYQGLGAVTEENQGTVWPGR
jgi:DNA-binding beta-propeller fold protein YncE